MTFAHAERRDLLRLLGLILGSLVVSGCALTSTPTAVPLTSLAPDVAVDCGPIDDRALCLKAVEVAATAKRNAPPIVAATIRRPAPGDECIAAFHPCGTNAVIVVIQSGDTLQDVPLIPSVGGWVRLDLVR